MSDKTTEGFHGHPDYITLTTEELQLHSAKNRDYARGGDPLGNFKRVANILSNYNDEKQRLDLANPTVVCIVYALKQLDAVLWMLSGNYEGDVENIDAKLTDAHIYLKIARILHILHKEEKDESLG